MNSFSLLNADIQELLRKTFASPTEPQVLGIPPILEGKDVLLIAPTGFGKTEAAVLPVFHHILDEKEHTSGISALYITPLRALNRDMLLRLDRWGKELGIDIEIRHGDTTAYKRRQQALKPPDLLITTPETIQAILLGKRLRQSLKSVRHVILDEVHELANSKRGAQLTIALERIVELAGDFQRICLSATVGNPEEVAKFFSHRKEMQVVNTASRKAIELKVITPCSTKRDELSARELGVDHEVFAHVKAIKNVVKAGKSCLIFVNTRRAAEMLAALINKFEPKLIGVHHGSLSRETRIEVEDKLKSGTIKGLICTSSMELGIDIGSIDIVIQYASPREVTRLVQRVGRASHSFQRTSSGIVIALTPDDVAESLVIARRAKSAEIEDIKLKENSLDVMANQICGVLLDFGVVSLDKVYSLISRAYPFRNVSYGTMMRVIEQLEDEWLLRVDGERLRQTKNTRSYYYENLSMIPDEKRYKVYDMVTGKLICMLDERFVLNFVTTGALFVAKGETWRVIDPDVDEGGEQLKVEPGAKKVGEIPKWEGEEIPVPFAIAQEVGDLRAKIGSFIVAGGSIHSIEAALEQEYGVHSDCFMPLIELINKQIAQSCVVPTATEVVVEKSKDGTEIVINACFGHLVNETFGRLIIALLGARIGADISMEIDPYRIKLKSGRKVERGVLEQTLCTIEPEFVRLIIEKTLKNSFLFKWELLNVAKRFGALRRTFDRRHISADKLVKLFEDTPIYEETLKDVFADKLDVARTEEVVRKLKSGDINVHFGSTSAIGTAGYLSWRDVLATEQDESLIIDALRNRIFNDRVILFCMSCKNWESVRRVKTIIEFGTESLVCPFCSSRLIAALKPWETEEIKLMKNSDSETGTNERVKRLYRNANLVLSHGLLAVIALAARGVGPEVASKIIRQSKDADHDFYRNILEQERRYTRTKRFWT